jgi:hypothetical protein
MGADQADLAANKREKCEFAGGGSVIGYIQPDHLSCSVQRENRSADD